MGLIQRAVEAAGIPTISISLSREITAKVKPPRAVFTGLPMGHPLGFPGQRFRQLQIMRFVLKHARKVTEPGVLMDLDFSESDDPNSTCIACGT